jgi:hypothetical protein
LSALNALNWLWQHHLLKNVTSDEATYKRPLRLIIILNAKIIFLKLLCHFTVNVIRYIIRLGFNVISKQTLSSLTIWQYNSSESVQFVIVPPPYRMSSIREYSSSEANLLFVVTTDYNLSFHNSIVMVYSSTNTHVLRNKAWIQILVIVNINLDLVLIFFDNLSLTNKNIN